MSFASSSALSALRLDSHTTIVEQTFLMVLPPGKVCEKKVRKILITPRRRLQFFFVLTAAAAQVQHPP